MNSWWIVDSLKHRRGPFTPSQVSLLLHLESISDDSGVYSEGLGCWVSFGSCDALKEAIAHEIGDDLSSRNSERLPMSELPVMDTMSCSDPSCPNTIASGGCDLVFIWDRKEKLWLTFDEYVKVCQESGLLAGLPDRLLASSSAQINDLLQEADGVAKRGNFGKQRGKSAAEVSENEDEPLSDPEKEAKRQKRRAYRERKKLKRDAGLWIKSRVNPNIYISGLPPDVSEAELYAIFHQAGQIKPDLQSKGHRIKIYGNGDALVTYMHEESVRLAIERFNEYFFRAGYVISVQQADFSFQQEEHPTMSIEEIRERAELNRDRRQKIMELYRKEKDLRSAWDLGDYAACRRAVVVFGPVTGGDCEFIGDKLEEFCEKFGTVKKLKFVANFFCVKFAKTDQAEACVAAVAAETDGFAVPDPSDASQSLTILPGFIHDGRDLTLLGSAAEPSTAAAVAPIMEWEEFLDSSDTDDEDLVIRTE